MSNSQSSDEIITYRFCYTSIKDKAKDSRKVFTLKLDAKTLDFIPFEQPESAEWTKLTHSQCPNCPLTEAEHPDCPIAINLTDLIAFFGSSVSFEEVDVTIESEMRAYQKHTTLQEGVSSLLSMYMVTSGCPIMDKMRPMLRAHMPFSTVRETTYRMLSMYLLAQYFLKARGGEPDWDLVRLKDMFDDIQLVNRHFWSRFASAKIEDASLNALVILDNLAQYAAFSVDLGMLSETELLFKAYFKD